MQKPKMTTKNIAKTYVLEISDEQADVLADRLIANGFAKPVELPYGWQFRHPQSKKTVCFYWSSKRSVWKVVLNFDPQELK